MKGCPHFALFFFLVAYEMRQLILKYVGGQSITCTCNLLPKAESIESNNTVYFWHSFAADSSWTRLHATWLHWKSSPDACSRPFCALVSRFLHKKCLLLRNTLPYMFTYKSLSGIKTRQNSPSRTHPVSALSVEHLILRVFLLQTTIS